MIVTAPGRKIVAIRSVNRSAAPGEPEPGEAVRDERAREQRPDRPDDRDRDRVEQQPRVVDEVPDLARSSPSAARSTQTALERPPRALPGDRRRVGCGRVDERALLPARLDQRELADVAVDRDAVDVAAPCPGR